MTTEANAVYQQLTESLRQGGSDDASLLLLRSILAKAQLTPEQEMVVDLLSTLQTGVEPPDNQVIEDALGGSEDGYREPLDDRKEIYRKTVNRLKEELADLREVNDTVAAALGACHRCWGGNDDCDICQGWGRAGWRAPHPKLFNELVAPAVNRVRALKRKSKR